jgi:hypothetical protein
VIVERQSRRVEGLPPRWCDVDDPDADEHWCSLVGVPPAEKFRRQIEAG